MDEIDSNWIISFIDVKKCFCINLSKIKDWKIALKVQLSFYVRLYKKDKYLLV